MSENTLPDRPPVGSRILFRWRKWDGSEHWVHDCVFLGSDRWGDWVGQRLTTVFALWKVALGKRPVDAVKALFQREFAAAPAGSSAASRDEDREEISTGAGVRSLTCAAWKLGLGQKQSKTVKYAFAAIGCHLAAFCNALGNAAKRHQINAERSKTTQN